MLFSTLFLLFPALVVEARNVHRPIRQRTVQTLKAPIPFSTASDLVSSPHVLPLVSKKTRPNPRSASHLLGHSKKIPVGNATSLVSLFLSEEFATSVTFGAQTFEFIVDTGSSDTWVIESNFTCVDVVTSEPEDNEYCGFGPTYELTEEFVQIPNENFNITYGDGEFLSGILGWENVTLAGISVNQTVPIVNFAAWYGDGETSGLLGLAYPGITSAYAGNDPTQDHTQVLYDPLFTTLYKQGLIPPVFSLAIERDLSGPAGYLALGGVPPVDFIQDFTSTPILITEIRGYPEAYDFYTINLDSVVLANQSLPLSGGSAQYIVDSGTTLNYFPTAVADAIAAAYVPPAVFSPNDGAYIVVCNASAPELGIKINGTTFWTNPIDMILLAGTDELGNNVCISGIDDGGPNVSSDVFILGDTFLKNVVAVFDVGAVEMKFAPREFYSSDNTGTARRRARSIRRH